MGEVELVGGIREMLPHGRSRLRVPFWAHGGFIGWRAGKRGALQRVGEKGAGQVGCGDTRGFDDGGECFQGRAAAGYGRVLAAIEGGEAFHGALDQLVRGDDFRCELLPSVGAGYQREGADFAVKMFEVAAEAQQMVDFGDQIALADGAAPE
ncbi:hypothetical protein [Streptomyces collinus]|uniref:hypothetical protein n=1 Tax=Streptomyces collinus TaxID=42684 RepID=UPI0037D210FF